MNGKRLFGRALLATVLLAVLLSGCSRYSFTGATVAEHLNTIAIPLAEERSNSPLSSLSESLTRRLVDRFVGQTRLRLEEDEEQADVVLSTSIDQYDNRPSSVSADERAALNRVTITIAVVYRDRVEDEEILRRTFTGYGEYDPLVGGLAGEEAAAVLALDRIADDVFTAATSDW